MSPVAAHVKRSARPAACAAGHTSPDAGLPVRLPGSSPRQRWMLDTWDWHAVHDKVPVDSRWPNDCQGSAGSRPHGNECEAAGNRKIALSDGLYGGEAHGGRPGVPATVLWLGSDLPAKLQPPVLQRDRRTRSPQRMRQRCRRRPARSTTRRCASADAGREAAGALHTTFRQVNVQLTCPGSYAGPTVRGVGRCCVHPCCRR